MKNTTKNTICIESLQQTSVSQSQKIQTYINVFGEAPWNEGYIDAQGNTYPLSYTGDTSGLRPYYDPEVLTKKREQRAQKEGYVEILATVLVQKNNAQCAGFCVGWMTDMPTLNTEKLGLAPSDYQNLIQTLGQQQGLGLGQQVFYASDLGVVASQRGQKLGSRLYDARAKSVIDAYGTVPVIVRTTRRNDVPYKRYLSKGYQEVYEYGDEQDRVLLYAMLEDVTV